MRLYISFMLNIWLVVTVAAVAAALPGQRRDASSWSTYKVWGGEPPFPPPDLGPLYFPKGYLDEYPYLTKNQVRYLRQKNFDEHVHHVRVTSFSLPSELLLALSLSLSVMECHGTCRKRQQEDPNMVLADGCFI